MVNLKVAYQNCLYKRKTRCNEDFWIIQSVEVRFRVATAVCNKDCLFNNMTVIRSTVRSASYSCLKLCFICACCVMPVVTSNVDCRRAICVIPFFLF